MKKSLAVFACAIGVMNASASAGIVVGYYTDFNTAAMGWEGPIAANGFTALQVLDISIFDFSTVDIMVIDESSNSEISAALLGRTADLNTYALGGGKIVIHDRYVTDSSWIPGGGGMTLIRDFTFDTDLNVVTGGTQVTSGPFGTIDDSTLDGGNSSNHGWALNLPGGATTFLSSGLEAFRAAALSYSHGSGFVFYSSIPLDFYLGGAGNDPPATAMREIYAPNVLAYMERIPAPGALALLGLGGIAIRRRRRSV